jgi:transposase
MATAREAHMTSMDRLMKLGRMHLDGKTTREIADHFKINPTYVYMLVKSFNRLTTPEGVGKLSRYMSDQESKELENIKDWLEFLTKETK